MSTSDPRNEVSVDDALARGSDEAEHRPRRADVVAYLIGIARGEIDHDFAAVNAARAKREADLG